MTGRQKRFSTRCFLLVNDRTFCLQNISDIRNNNDQSWKRQLCLHGFTFTMTGAGKSDNYHVFTLSLSRWPELVFQHITGIDWNKALLEEIMFGFAWCCDIVESLHDALQSLWINSDNSLSVFLGNFYAEERLRKKWASEKCMVSKKRLLVLRKYRRSLFPNLHILQRLRIRVRSQNARFQPPPEARTPDFEA